MHLMEKQHCLIKSLVLAFEQGRKISRRQGRAFFNANYRVVPRAPSISALGMMPIAGTGIALTGGVKSKCAVGRNYTRGLSVRAGRSCLANCMFFSAMKSINKMV